MQIQDETQDKKVELLQVDLQTQNIHNNIADSSMIKGDSMVVTQTNRIRYPNNVESVLLEKKNYVKIRDLCENVHNSFIAKEEIYLAIAMLFFGASLSAISSGLILQFELRSIIFYVVSPAVALGCFVAYLFSRKIEISSKKDLADRVLDYLPDPKDVDGGE